MFRSEISKEEVAGLDLIQFEGPLQVIDSDHEFEQLAAELRPSKLLGFDTETRPSFKKGLVYPTSIIQLATQEQAWILRVGKMGYPPLLRELLSDESILKVGLSLKDDIRRMQADLSFEPRGFLDLQQYVQAFGIEELGLKKLSALVLGRRISKSQQVSNWDAHELTEAQLRYAATDAWICVMIYNKLKSAILS